MDAFGAIVNWRVMMKNAKYLLLTVVLLLSCNNNKSNRVENSVLESSAIEESTTSITTINNEYSLNIDPDFIGVYLPIEYIEAITQTKNHSLTVHSENAKYHNFLNVKINMIYSDLGWHDSYAIKKVDNDKFQYLVEGDDHTIVDNNGYHYVRMSTDTENSYRVINEYVINIILKDLIDQRKVIIKDNFVIIESKQFEVSLDDMFMPKDNNLILYNREEKTYLGMKILGKKYVFYRLIPSAEKEEFVNSDEIVFQSDAE
jgi:hypothetical protein